MTSPEFMSILSTLSVCWEAERRGGEVNDGGVRGKSYLLTFLKAIIGYNKTLKQDCQKAVSDLEKLDFLFDSIVCIYNCFYFLPFSLTL